MPRPTSPVTASRISRAPERRHARVAAGTSLPVQAPVEPLDQPPDPGDGMADRRVKAVGIADGRLRREGEAQDQQAVGEGMGESDE